VVATAAFTISHVCTVPYTIPYHTHHTIPYTHHTIPYHTIHPPRTSWYGMVVWFYTTIPYYGIWHMIYKKNTPCSLFIVYGFITLFVRHWNHKISPKRMWWY
jgi:hypothetical protein